MDRYEQIRENFRLVRERIGAAMERRIPGAPGRVRLLAATKTVPPDEILFAQRELGLDLIGENRTDELKAKYPALDGRIEQHFIGHLQTNKVRQVVGRVTLIESVDSRRLAEEIDRRSEALGLVSDILLEINSGREPNKSGVAPEDVPAALAYLAQFSHLRVRGFMTMAPVCAQKEDYRKYFRETYAIFIDFCEKNKHNIIEPVLSMGMSDSYETALEEGATEIRVGQALFGRRVYPAAPTGQTSLSQTGI